MARKSSQAGTNMQALFGAKSGERLSSGLKIVPRDSIRSGQQPRQSFPPAELSELARSISELQSRHEGIEGTGLLQPLLVTAQNDGYLIIAGERRFRASAQAGLTQLPVIVVPAPAQGLLMAQLIENLQRRDLPPLEEAEALAQLMSEQKLSVREAAAVLGKGKGYLEERLRLRKMPSDLQTMVSGRPDTLTHAREIAAVADEKTRALLIQAVVQEGASVAEIRRRITSASATSSSAAAASPKAGFTAAEQHPQEPDSTPSATPISESIDAKVSPSQLAPSTPKFSLKPMLALAQEADKRLRNTKLSARDRRQILSDLEELKRLLIRIEESIS